MPASGLRFFTASLGTETNTFAPIPTSRRSFEETLYVPGHVQAGAGALPAGPAAVLRALAPSRGWEVRYGVAAFAQPGGITTRAAYEGLRDELLRDLAEALPVDAVVLGLHGAMVASGCPDCEGDLLARVRALAGERVVIGAVLDPHAHLTTAMVANADALVFFKHYPHTDVAECATQLVEIVAAAAEGRYRPVMSVANCRMIDVYHTTREPMAGFVREMSAAERAPVLSVSLVHGFPWGDVAEMGTKVLVVTDAAPEAGTRLAREFAHRLFALRGTTGPARVGVGEAMARVAAAGQGPVVVADGADNPGGGAPGDATFVLRAALDAGLDDAAFGMFWDPHAVRLAADAGEGERLTIRLGGKTCELSGVPVDLDVVVRRVVPNVVQHFAGLDWHAGQTALLEAGPLQVVVTERRVQTFLPDVFTGLGVDLATKRLVVVKSAQHFYAAFAPLAASVVYVDAPGVLVNDLSRLPFRHADTTQWPFDPALTLV